MATHVREGSLKPYELIKSLDLYVSSGPRPFIAAAQRPTSCPEQPHRHVRALGCIRLCHPHELADVPFISRDDLTGAAMILGYPASPDFVAESSALRTLRDRYHRNHPAPAFLPLRRGPSRSRAATDRLASLRRSHACVEVKFASIISWILYRWRYRALLIDCRPP
jgi:hypothetical protein